jgi:hypothetical protein
MWLCTKLGFYSIVQKEPGTYHIRARSREDLDRLAAAAGTGTPVDSYPGSDYPWRIICSGEDLPRFFEALAGGIDYGNFKSAIAADATQRSKLSPYHDIHHRMLEWQWRQEKR